MKILGYQIEKITEIEKNELDHAMSILKKYGFRVVRLTEDKTKKIESAKKATALKIKQSKEKVTNAIKELESTNQKINIANVAKLANISRITAKKYMDI